MQALAWCTSKLPGVAPCRRRIPAGLGIWQAMKLLRLALKDGRSTHSLQLALGIKRGLFRQSAVGQVGRQPG